MSHPARLRAAKWSHEECHGTPAACGIDANYSRPTIDWRTVSRAEKGRAGDAGRGLAALATATRRARQPGNLNDSAQRKVPEEERRGREILTVLLVVERTGNQ